VDWISGIKSPQILELSGIGNPAVLERLGVPVAVDLPTVGENLQEHISLWVTWELKDDVTQANFDTLREADADTILHQLELQ
jgi:choline dehydrogenase-like flavoprotein